MLDFKTAFKFLTRTVCKKREGSTTEHPFLTFLALLQKREPNQEPLTDSVIGDGRLDANMTLCFWI